MSQTVRAGRFSMERLKAFAVEYGPIALVTHYVVLGLFLAAVATAIRMGFKPLVSGVVWLAVLLGFEPPNLSGDGGFWVALVAAYGVAKLLQPIRIGITLALTPLVAKAVRRKAKQPPPP